MYQVIIVLDESKTKNYYYSYVTVDGNIECEELPPYQDIDKARSCWWDADNSAWIYDEEKYQEIISKKEQENAIAEAIKAEAEAQPTINELSDAVMELATCISDIEMAIVELGDIVGKVV